MYKKGLEWDEKDKESLKTTSITLFRQQAQVKSKGKTVIYVDSFAKTFQQ